MLNRDHTLLLVIDMQEKLLRAMHDWEELLDKTQRLIRGIGVLGMPLLFTEQNPSGLGSTVLQIAQLVAGFKSIPKMSFSCCATDEFMQALQSLQRKQVLICGIEAHVCVYGTAMELKYRGYEVQVVADCISSRSADNIKLTLDRLGSEGIRITSMEMALFELLRTAESAEFKAIQEIVR